MFGQLQENPDPHIAALHQALEEVRKVRPGGRDELDHSFAILITELRKVIAFAEMNCKLERNR